MKLFISFVLWAALAGCTTKPPDPLPDAMPQAVLFIIVEECGKPAYIIATASNGDFVIHALGSEGDMDADGAAFLRWAEATAQHHYKIKGADCT